MINLHKSTEPFEFDDSNWFEHEKPSVLEAFRVLSKEGYYITISGHDYDMRKKRLEKEYEKNTKAPGSAENSIKGDLSGNKSIEHCGEPIPGSPLSAVEGIKLKWKDNQNTSENPALAESASQFNDALLDEQAKKIEKLAYENERLKDQIVVLDACKKHNDKIDRLQIKRLGKEIAKLNGIIHDKNAILADVAEELRLSKIREKNLTEVCQKYVKEVEDLREKLANNVVDKIDAQALKSAESALAWKEKLIYYKDMAIADLRKELKAQKGLVNHISKKYDGAKINLNLRMKECEKLKEALEEKTKLVEMVRKGSREYCEYGIAAEKMIQKMAKDIVNDRPVSPKDYEQYRHWAKGYRFNPQLPERTDEEEKKLNTAKSTLDDLKEKAYNSFNAKAHNLGPVGSKDGNGIIDQMIGVDIAEEGGDHSAIIAQCYKNIAISKDEAEIIERCTKNGTELHYSEKDGFTYTNVFGDEMPIICLRGMCQVFTDEEIKNMKK